ncbi:hypothetical protein BGW38_006931 [Lunasporangiospora selenospora]|uniref:Uncharacterized protein n=1 Tax=Lunasporangiospora selenospora TaxID=979761 RepID=A0A9P6G0U5_9FUNG|nr:hypothetical protein BGW38_006931 [Lunasporangiospora selenospora]
MSNPSTSQTSVPLPSFQDILKDLSALNAAHISLLVNADEQQTTPPISSHAKLEKFKASTEKNPREQGVIENGFEVAVDYITMHQQLAKSRDEIKTLQGRTGTLERELSEVRETIAVNAI